MSDNVDRNSSGIGVFGLLGVAFVILKLCGVIDWSWWWVTAPFWGAFAIVIVLMIAMLIIGGTASGILAINAKLSKRKKMIVSKDHEVIE